MWHGGHALLLHAASRSQPTRQRVKYWAVRALHAACAQHLAFDFYDTQPGGSDAAAQGATQRAGATGSTCPGSNSAHTALLEGVTSRLIEFQITPDEAIRRFHAHQAAECHGMHAHSLLSPGGPASLRTAYFPVWTFTCSVTAEYRGHLGFREPSTPGGMVWKEMEEWRTLGARQQLSFQDHPHLQVYASYAFERGLGVAAQLPTPGCLADARPLTPTEAEALWAAPGAAAAPAGQLSLAQQGPARMQQPQATTGGGTSGDEALPPWEGTRVVVHPPDMSRAIAWQVAYRALMRRQVAAAAADAVAGSGAADARDMHVTLQIHHLHAELLYLPVYVAHYQHGDRYKHGTSGVIAPQMFYAAISGLRKGDVVALPHVSPQKAQAATVLAVGGLGAAAGVPTWLGLEAFLPLGPVEWATLAVIGAALAGMWAHARPQAARNNITARQVRAEREFYRQYDVRETKTAAAIAAAVAAAEAAGRPPPSVEAGEVADEYMQWLWMDYDWGKWEGEEPWNWDPAARRAAAEQIAARTVARRRERQLYLLRLLEERRRQQQELEQDLRGGPRTRRGAARAAFGSTPDGGAPARGRRDFLGYYKLLGLTDADDITAEVIKTAFKAQAMQLHPDRVSAEGGSTELVQQAHVKFQRLQIAYDALRDPEKRRAYDRGQLVQ